MCDGRPLNTRLSLIKDVKYRGDIMNYKEVVEYIESLVPREFNPSLAPLSEASSFFDNPGLSFPSVHVAGTNGKGSTSTFLTSILMHNGYRVGLYTSPHLVDVRERIQIDRVPISESDFIRLVEKVRTTIPNDRSLSYFEFLTLVSFLFFKEKKVDIAVIETGLGGRLDATNIINPQVSVITPVSFDHKEHLGNTLADIAREKCGIIKRGVPAVVAEQQKEVMEVIKRWCDDMGAPLCVAKAEDILEPLGLLGKHQKQNASCAVEAAQLLPTNIFTIKNINKALLETKWAGRLEVVKTAPKVLLDGAHNPAGAHVLAEFISEEIDRDKAVLMIGIMADKDINAICSSLVPCVREVVCVEVPSKRGASPKDVGAAARSFGAKVSSEGPILKALPKWLKKLNKNDTLIISGSLAVVGEAKKFFNKK
ncbi:MAG: hypothetical protein COS89_08080 [Deltaproteobacteria bacterium CG07_land_8_20_14_0_80_38_7]|nr:MAG: hypothetical protein COS89_08080 [Deltaproteobacteria bacterium CG07_land_8_20_14_0_80_38_7]